MRLEEYLEKNTQILVFEKGQIIFGEGQEAAAAYYVIEGSVEIFQGKGASASVMAMLGPDEIFGEMALLRFDKYTLSARAAAKTRLYVIPPEMLHEQIRATHPLIKAIIDMLIDRVHGANEILIDHERLNRP